MNVKLLILPFLATLLLSISGCNDHEPAAHAEGSAGAHDTHNEHDSDHESHDDHDDSADHSEAGHDDIELTEDAARAAGIVVSKAQMTAAASYLELPAEIRLDQDRIANVSSQVSGVITTLLASEGDQVAKNDRLAVIASRELADLKAGYLSARAAEDVALSALKREEQLWADKITSEADLINARAASQLARTTRENAENKLHAIGIGHSVIGTLNEAKDGDLSQYIVRAPMTGVVVRRPATLGQAVTSGDSGGELLFTIVDPTTVWADIAVFRQDISRVSIGAPVTLRSPAGDVLVNSEIAFISPLVDESSRTATARVFVNNETGVLRAGQFVTASIETSLTRPQLRVPASAVQTVEGQSVVFVPTAHGFAPAPVTLGVSANGHVEITSGLEAGRRFVSEGAFTLKAQLEKADFGDGHSH